MTVDPAAKTVEGPSRRTKLIFRALALTLSLLIIELLSWGAIAIMRGHDVRRIGAILEEQSDMVRGLLDPGVSRHIEAHPVLGWRYAAGFKNANHEMNSMALRSNREYTATPPAGVLRVAAFGDSYVYGSEVDDADAWAAQIESGNADIEVLNFGVGGYGVDQAYLRYLLEGSTLAPHIVLMGFTPDDIGRTVNVYRRFLASRDFVLFKPRYQLGERGELTLLDVPVRERHDFERLLANPREVIHTGRHDHWYRPIVYENPVHDYSAAVRLACYLTDRVYRKHVDPERPIRNDLFNTSSSAYRIQAILFEMFSAAVRSADAVPLVIILPDEESVRRARRNEKTVYTPLLRHMGMHGVTYLDAVGAFRDMSDSTDVKAWFAPKGHYTALGNKIIASWIAGHLRSVSPLQAALRLRGAAR